jgi:hypothetical protein
MHKIVYLFTLLTILFLLNLIHDPAYAQPAGAKNADIIELIIQGTVHPDQQYSYRLEPFDVPEGIGAIEFTFSYDGRGEYAEMEIGLFDPFGFRGTSRFSKDSFYISKYRTTASYFPGDIAPGLWNVSLGFPTITQEAGYTIHIRMIPEGHPEYYGPSEIALDSGKRWYKGDFHTHTGHSDGFGCPDTEGNRSPCQVFQTAQASHRNGLDFVSIADHNTVSHHQDMNILQPSFPGLLLVRGQEVTTFYGHMNVFGTSIPVEFRIGYEGITVKDIQEQSRSLGALFSINHPGRDTGASCTGCGWSAENTDYNLVDAIEVVNGTNIETRIAGIPFWHERLNEGYRITGIGGSDDHGAGFGRSQPGTPTTMVYAESLSEADLLKAVKKGRVYLRTRSPDGPAIEFTATDGVDTWQMGDVIPVDELEKDQPVYIQIKYDNYDFVIPEIIWNGESVEWKPENSLVEAEYRINQYRINGFGPGWVRFNLRDDEGIVVVSNPIYIR